MKKAIEQHQSGLSQRPREGRPHFVRKQAYDKHPVIKFSRRCFLRGAATAAAFMIVPRHVLGGSGHTPPSERLNIACIGVGGRGAYDIGGVATENIVAMCDVDEQQAAAIFSRYPDVRKYHDYRKMLEKEKDIDAVVVATPDHTHAVVSITAIKMGKHVYCEKPLAHTIYETRKIVEAARLAKVATQMGVQLHATDALKLLVEMLKSGVIGDVRQVELWTDRPIWPQGLERPDETPPVPSTLDWDLWLGPAPYRAYNPAYLPIKWRGWWDFGTGALGDMGCHIFDPAFWALELGCPASVEAVSTKVTSESPPKASVVRYEFPSRGNMPPVKLTWHDGGIKPCRPEKMQVDKELPDSGGIYVGDKGTILAPHLGDPILMPESAMKDFKPPEPFLPRGTDHHQEWLKACKGVQKPSADFDYSGPLTEAVLLGNIAIRTGKKLYWDGPSMKVTNLPEANEYIHRQYRQGWGL